VYVLQEVTTYLIVDSMIRMKMLEIDTEMWPGCKREMESGKF
jgi:hypothetical protein